MKAIYPGSFDPITNGHLDIIQRAVSLFDPLIVAVLSNPGKDVLFSAEDRVKLIREAIGENERVRIVCFEGLLVDFMRKQEAQIAIRGMRAISDFDYEFQMALTNKGLYASMETVFLVSRGEYAFISSSMVKEVCRLGGDISTMAPPGTVAALKKRFTG